MLSGTWSIRTFLHSLQLRARIFNVSRARWRAFFAVEARLPFSHWATDLFARALRFTVRAIDGRSQDPTGTGTQRGERKEENKLKELSDDPMELVMRERDHGTAAAKQSKTM